jgi:hypothetical protein
MWENQRQGYWNRKLTGVDLTPTEGGEPPSASREPSYKQYYQDPMPMYMTSGLGSMEISRLQVEAVSAATKPPNQMPLVHSRGVPSYLGSDMMTFLHKYESIAAFTATDPFSLNVVVMLPYYCTEAMRGLVMMLCCYESRHWAVLKKEMRLGIPIAGPIHSSTHIDFWRIFVQSLEAVMRLKVICQVSAPTSR